MPQTCCDRNVSPNPGAAGGSPQASLLGLQTTAPACLPTRSYLRARTQGLITSKNTSQLAQGPPWWPQLTWMPTFQTPAPNLAASHLPGVGHHHEFWGHTVPSVRLASKLLVSKAFVVIPVTPASWSDRCPAPGSEGAAGRYGNPPH